MTTDKSSKQAALPMGTTPASADVVEPVTVTFTGEWARLIRLHAEGLAELGESRGVDGAARDLIDTGYSVNDWARSNLLVCTAIHEAPAVQPATAAPAPEAQKPTRTGDAIIGDIARKIAEHTIACGAGFWTGGVPEVRAALGVDADGQTIAAAFRRIERGQVAGVVATQCGHSHRARGTFALWTVAVAPKKPAA